MLRKTILATILSLPLYLVACSSISQSEKSQRNLLEVELPNLVVNTDNDFRCITRKDEQSGLEDMFKLSEESPYEEAWVFLPKKNLWIEVGYGEKFLITASRTEAGWFKHYESAVALDREKINSLFKENREIHVYHIHTRSKDEVNYFIEAVVRTFGPRTQEEIEELRKADTDNLERVKNYRALPSKSDLKAMISQSLEFYKENQEGHMENRICSPKGITLYSITQKGRKDFTFPWPLSYLGILSTSDNVYKILNSTSRIAPQLLIDRVKTHNIKLQFIDRK